MEWSIWMHTNGCDKPMMICQDLRKRSSIQTTYLLKITLGRWYWNKMPCKMITQRVEENKNIVQSKSQTELWVRTLKVILSKNMIK